MIFLNEIQYTPLKTKTKRYAQPFGWPYAAPGPALLNAQLPLPGPQAALCGQYIPTPMGLAASPRSFFEKRIEDAERHIRNLETDQRFLEIQHQEEQVCPQPRRFAPGNRDSSSSVSTNTAGDERPRDDLEIRVPL